MRTCHTCHRAKPLTEFSVNRARKDGLTLECRECNQEKCRRYYRANRERELQRHREVARRWRQEHPDEAQQRDRARAPAQRANARARHRRYKEQVLDRYGRQCVCCGSVARLSIDHIDGDGGVHRAEIRAQSAIDFYRWLISAGFPLGFQTLCMRCNTSKGRSDRCRLDHSK